MGARKRIRKPPAPARRMHHGDVQEALRRAEAGWTAEDIARSLAIDLDDVRIWMLTLAETQRVAVPVGETVVPDDFSPVRLLRQIAASEVTPASVRVRACGMLLQDAEARARIDWMAVKVEDIPPDARPALAGALAADVVAGGRVSHDFSGASPAQQQLFLAVGVLVDDAFLAEELLVRFRGFAELIRAEAIRRSARRRLTAPTIRHAAEFKPGSARTIDVEAEEVDGDVD